MGYFNSGSCGRGNPMEPQSELERRLTPEEPLLGTPEYRIPRPTDNQLLADGVMAFATSTLTTPPREP